MRNSNAVVLVCCAALGVFGACHNVQPEQARRLPVGSASEPATSAASGSSSAEPASSVSVPTSPLKFHLVADNLDMVPAQGITFFSTELGILGAEVEANNIVSHPEHYLGLESGRYYDTTFFGHWPDNAFLSVSEPDNSGGRDASLFHWSKDKWERITLKRPGRPNPKAMYSEQRMGPPRVLPWADGSSLIINSIYDTHNITLQVFGGAGKAMIPKPQLKKKGDQYGPISKMSLGFGAMPPAAVVDGDLFLFATMTDDASGKDSTPVLASEHWVAGSVQSTIDVLPIPPSESNDISSFKALSKTEIYLVVRPESADLNAGQILFTFDGKQWSRPDMSWQGAVVDLVETADHTLMASTTKGELWSKKKGSAWALATSPPATGRFELKTTSDGSLWAAIPKSGIWHKPSTGTWARVELPGSPDPDSSFNVVVVSAELTVLLSDGKLFQTHHASQLPEYAKAPDTSRAEIFRLKPSSPYTAGCATPLLVLGSGAKSPPGDHEYDAILDVVRGIPDLSCATPIEFESNGLRKLALSGGPWECSGIDHAKWAALVRKKLPTLRTETLCYYPKPLREY